MTTAEITIGGGKDKVIVKNDVPKAVEIKQEVKNMAAFFEHEMKIDNKTGIATVPKDAYTRLLPEGLTEETINQVQHHNTVVAAAATLALGNKAIPVMTKNKELDRVELEIPTVGKDTFSVTFDRSRQVPDRSPDNTGGVRTQHGTTRTTFNMYGTDSRGELKKVKTHLQAEASAAFGEMAKK